MEQQRKGLIVAQNARTALGQRRAMELEAKHPQIGSFGVELPAEIMRGSGMSGGEAGLRRIIGTGKRGKKMVEMEEDSTPAGGALYAGASLRADAESSDEEGAKEQAKMLGEHLGKKHGGAYMAKFAKQMMRGHGMYQVAHNVESGVGLPGSGTGGQDVPPGGVAPITYGNVPQAPASFKRNTVGMGAPAGGAMTGGFPFGLIASLAAPLLGKLLGSGDITEDAHGAILGGAKHSEAELVKSMDRAVAEGKMSKKAHAAMVKKLKGKGFLSNLGIPIVSDIARVFGLGAPAGGAAGGGELHIVHKGMGRTGGVSHRMPDGSMMAGKPCKVARGGASCGGVKKPSARGALIKRVMADQCCSMIEASKYIKENGLKA